MDEKPKSILRKVWGVFSYILILLLVVHGGIAVFGSWFEADKKMLKETATGKDATRFILWYYFGEPARIEVRHDYSIHAYISKEGLLPSEWAKLVIKYAENPLWTRGS